MPSSSYLELTRTRMLTYYGGPLDGETRLSGQILAGSDTEGNLVADEDGVVHCWTWCDKHCYDVVGDLAFYAWEQKCAWEEEPWKGYDE